MPSRDRPKTGTPKTVGTFGVATTGPEFASETKILTRFHFGLDSSQGVLGLRTGIPFMLLTDTWEEPLHLVRVPGAQAPMATPNVEQAPGRLGYVA